MAGARKKASPSGRYQGFFIDHTGKKRYFTGSTRRTETLRIARKLEEDHRQIRLGYREPRQTHFKYRDRSFMDTVGEYLEWGKLQGGRKPAFQPLPKRLIMQLELFCGSGMVQALYKCFCRNFTYPKDALLYVPSHPARELDKDLEAAGILKHTDDGKIAFHALRTCFISLTYEAGATHREAQALARHSNPTLTANTYGRTRNERLAKVAEMVAERVLSGQVGANMVHEIESEGSVKIAKLRSEQQLTTDSAQWRRGDSNPRPEMFQDKRLHA